ncbi:MAG: hypothetical protein PHC28_08980 [Flavobacterium sp.]|uniref:hypothetical protein n=1 Tax=Flavobacterium sp. TaxID=239 RepID=UPI0026273FE9|nr:hypothetical protein [Flavobacterium sp.]MDD5150602.1 hypothetical protein [Flavobacterium sp.]
MAVNLGIHDFLSNFKGGARPNLYAVVLSFPTGLGLNLVDKSQKLAYMCKAASIPASTMGKAEVSFMGRKVKVAGDKDYDDWDITVVNDVSFDLRSVFEQWHEKINGNITNRANTIAVNPSNYYATADVYQLNKDGNTLAHYKIEGMFPTSVAAIELGFETVDTIEEFAVTFSVNQWARIGITNLNEINSELSALIANTKVF